MRKKKKPSTTKAVVKFVAGGIFNLVEDVVVEACNSVPGYPKIESYGQYCRRTKAKKGRR